MGNTKQQHTCAIMFHIAVTGKAQYALHVSRATLLSVSKNEYD